MKVAVAFAALVATAAALAPLNMMDDAIEDNYIVVFKKTATKFDRASHKALVKTSAQLDDKFQITKEFDINDDFHAYSAVMNAQVLATARTDPNIAYIEQDSIMSINAPVQVELNATGPAADCKVQLEATWGLVRTSQRDLNINGEYMYDADSAGKGVDVYILDTGIMTTHVEFEGRAVNGDYKIPDRGHEGSDGNGHGTHVAGTVMSKTYGVAKEAKAIAVKVLSAGGSGSNTGVIGGVEYTCDDHKEKSNKCVANMSLGGGRSTALNEAVLAASKCGCTYAVASGNSNANACNYSPAGAGGPGSEIITVNSFDSKDEESSFSNHGTCTDIYAPGSAITSTWIGSDYAINTISGTSMASPHVAGVAAIVAGEKTTPTPTSVKADIINAGTPNKLSRVPIGSPNLVLYESCSV